MIRKKLLLFVTMLGLSLVLAACGNSNGAAGTSPAADENETVTDTLQTEETDTNGKNILIAYFSHTGNTEEVAKMIAGYTGGDLAEIERAEEYGDLQEEAEVEILNGVHPEITVSVDNIAEYDTIFVGYPIWWDEAPAMIATFLADNDFSGKTIIPFCTSSSDDIGNSLHIFSELCPDAEIAEGLTANELNDIEPWIQGLGLMESTADDQNNQTNTSAGSKILIACFTVPETDGVDTVASASRVVKDDEVFGNTEFIASIIQETLGGDLFAIETVQEYPGSHEPLLEFAYNEKSDDARPELSSYIENLSEYDVIFVGFPNWNADLPMPLYTFFEEYDFSGKTLIPFVTHGSSGFSSAIRTIKSLEPDATVVEDGLSVSRNNVADAEDDVKAWAESLLKD